MKIYRYLSVKCCQFLKANSVFEFLIGGGEDFFVIERDSNLGPGQIVVFPVGRVPLSITPRRRPSRSVNWRYLFDSLRRSEKVIKTDKMTVITKTERSFGRVGS